MACPSRKACWPGALLFPGMAGSDNIALLRKAFPDAPYLFLYREPQAVLASHQRQRGPQMIPSMLHPALLPLPTHQLAPGDHAGYAGVLLSSPFAAAQPRANCSLLTTINCRTW